MQMIRQKSKRSSGLRPWRKAFGIAVFALVFAVSQAWAAPYETTSSGFFSSTIFDSNGDGVTAAFATLSGSDSLGHNFVCSSVYEAVVVEQPTGACGPEEVELVLLPNTVRTRCQFEGYEDIFNYTGTGTICLAVSCFQGGACSGTSKGTSTLAGGSGIAEGSSGSFTYTQTFAYTQADAGTVSQEVEGDIELAAGAAFPGELDSALIGAITAGDIDAVRTALNDGASVQVRDEDGMTPLHDASIWGHVEIVQLLLDAGADVNARDEQGWTPLDWVEVPPWGVPQASDELIQLLKDAGGE